MDRASTFSDPGIIRRLQTEFIPVVGNTHEVQNGRSLTRDWFMKMAASVNPRVLENITSQGFYVAAPDGTAYGFNNNRTVDRVNWFMDGALEKWRENPGAKVEVTSGEVESRFARTPPPGTTLVRVYSRIKPLPAGADPLNTAVGRDHFWIYQNEVASLFSALQSRSKLQPPKEMLARLLRFHLVDNVRGEPNFWQPAEVSSASFNFTPGQLRISFEGKFSMRTSGGGRGLAGSISGEIGFATDGKIKSFKAFAETQAWGAGTYTPRPPEGKFPLLFAFQLVNDEIAQTVPPQGNLYAGEYEKPALPEALRTP